MTGVEIAAVATGLGLFSVPISWLWARQNSMIAKLEQTYTKDEAKEMIDLKQRPLKDALDRTNEVCGELTKVMQDLRIELARIHGEREHGKDN